MASGTRRPQRRASEGAVARRRAAITMNDEDDRRTGYSLDVRLASGCLSGPATRRLVLLGRRSSPVIQIEPDGFPDQEVSGCTG